MSGYWLDIALVGVLVLVNAAFAGSEMALVSLREGQLRQLERQGGARALRLVRLARDPNRFLATIQIGITLAGFLASATAAVLARRAPRSTPDGPGLGGGAAGGRRGHPGADLRHARHRRARPEAAGHAAALPWALAVAPPLDVLSTLSRPVVALLGSATNAVVRLLGGRSESEVEEISPEELRDLVTSHRDLNEEQREIISGALEIHERMLREVLVPRGSVVTISADTSLTDACATMAAAGHSRIPVTRRHHLDDVVGIVHWASVLEGGSAPVETVAAHAMVLPDTVRVSDALRQFKVERQQMALVVDEHGAVDGIVTLEDLLEEIVGEIWDETDADVLSAERSDDGSVTLPGTFPVHDLEDVGVRLESASGDYTTVAGLVLLHLGRVPETSGDRVEVDGWSIEVLEVGHHAITKVLLRPVPAAGREARASGR